MIHLSVETSTDQMGMALLEDGRVLGEVQIRLSRGASEMLVPSMDVLLEGREEVPTSIGLISCSRGPGSYTSLRVGFMFCRGLSETLGAELVTVSPFDVLFRQFPGSRETPVLAVLNARQGQVSGVVFGNTDNGGTSMHPVPENPADFVSRLPPIPLRVVGPGRSLLEPWRKEHSGWIWLEGEDAPPRAGFQGMLAWEHRNLLRDEVGLVYGRAPV